MLNYFNWDQMSTLGVAGASVHLSSLGFTL